MSAVEFLLEVGVEELPPGAVAKAAKTLQRKVVELLDAQDLSHGEATNEWTPRRLVVSVADVASASPLREETKRGPSLKAAFDTDGNPTRACTGFAKSQGVEPGDLQKVETPKGSYLTYTRTIGGEAATAILSRGLAEVISSLPWRRSMRWAPEAPVFARPIRWLLASLGGEVVPFSMGPVTSGLTSRGHRFTEDSGPFEATSLADLTDGLRARQVVLRACERKAKIAEELSAAAKEQGGEVVEAAGLLDELAAINEWPRVLAGSFDDKYLEVPEVVLSTAMVKHQKMFAVRSTSSGKLLPMFLGVTNTSGSSFDLIRGGFERVLRARLDDGRFFYEDDRSKPLADRLDELEGIIFLRGLGTMADKTRRLEALSAQVAELIAPSVGTDAKRAATLSKCDLLTEVVGEFPELQGIMGRIYARLDGESDAAAEAVFEHYLPRHAGDDLPASKAGICVALADRLDTLAGGFAVGKAPTGSADPFALRRASLGVLRIELGHSMSLSLSDLLERALKQHDAAQEKHAELKDQLTAFLRARLKVELSKGEGHPVEIVEAVLSVNYDDPLDAKRRVEALSALNSGGDLADTLEPFKRCLRIGADVDSFADVNPALFDDDAERSLWAAVEAAQGHTTERFAAGDYEGGLAVLDELKPKVGQLFDDVMVMADDPAVRANRLALTHAVAAMFAGVADFAQIGA